MVTLRFLDTFKEELLMINFKYNFINSLSSATRDSLRSFKTIFWYSLENYRYIRTFLFLKNININRKHELKELKNLQRLYLSYNQLKEVPNFNLPNLQYLDLFNNQLKEVPDFNLPMLQSLYLSNNQLTEEEKKRLKKKYGNKINSN